MAETNVASGNRVDGNVAGAPKAASSRRLPKSPGMERIKKRLQPKRLDVRSLLARMAKRKSRFNTSRALKTLLLLCLLPIILGVPANQAMSLDAVSPSIRIDRTEFFLGEQVAFETGKRTAELVAGPALAETLCELKVIRPDGKEIVQKEGGPTTYDGPSRVSFLSQPELLNDMDHHLAVGRYQIVYACGLQKTSVSIQLRELPILREIHVALQFPAQVRLSVDKTLKVGVTVSNHSGRAIKIVVPGSNYWARVIAYADCRQPPAWMLLQSDSEAHASNSPNYRVRVSSAHMDKLQLHTIPAEGSYSAEFEFHGTAIVGGLVDPQWFPKEQFEIMSGLVLHLFLPMDVLPQRSDRPIELLIRSKACYAVAGERQNTGCEGAIKHWPHAPLEPR